MAYHLAFKLLVQTVEEALNRKKNIQYTKYLYNKNVILNLYLKLIEPISVFCLVIISFQCLFIYGTIQFIVTNLTLSPDLLSCKHFSKKSTMLRHIISGANGNWWGCVVLIWRHLYLPQNVIYHVSPRNLHITYIITLY